MCVSAYIQTFPNPVSGDFWVESYISVCLFVHLSVCPSVHLRSGVGSKVQAIGPDLILELGKVFTF